MKHFNLNLTTGNPLKAIEINRKFQAATINFLSDPVEDALKLHNLHSLNITFKEVLHEGRKCLLKKEALVDALENMKLLKTFSADSVRFDDSSEKTSVKAIQMLHLKKLELKFSSVYILTTFSTKSLTSFSFHNIEAQQDSTLIVELLNHQPLLESLKICGTICDHLLQHPSTKTFPFKLKFFKINKTILSDDESSNQLVEFLKLHKDSLEELTIKTATTSVLKSFVFASMTSLKALQMSFARKTVNELSDLQPLLNVTRFKIIGDLGRAVNVNAILRLFPSLKVLNMTKLTIRSSQDFDNIFRFIQRQYPGLESLHCACLQSGDQHRKFTNLKEFHVAKIQNENDYNEFIREHAATLEIISIKSIKDDAFVRGLTVDAIKRCTNLKHISFSSDSPVVTKMFGKIQRNYSWTLESRFFIEYGLKPGKWIALKFQFPDDEAVWQEHCRTWDDELIRTFETSPNYGLNAFINKFK